jgi:uncharacterized membrane protein YwzB
MIEIVITLIYSVVMLMFMAFPAIKIVEFIKNKKELSKRVENLILISITIILSLIVGVFLQF